MVSLVVPDLLETTKSARLRLTPSATCLTAPGSVESSTSMSGKPIFEPKVSLKTAPVDEEPPMPSRTTWEYCRRRTSSAKPRMSSEWPRMMVGEVSQPEPVPHRGRVALPEGGVLHPEAIEELARLEEAQGLLHRGQLERVRQHAAAD